MGDREAALRVYNQAQEQSKHTGDPSAPQLYYQFLSSSVVNDPSFARAWVEIGDANSLLDAPAGAIAAYRIAADLPELDKTERAKCLISMGHLLHRIGRVEEAAKVIHRGLTLDDSLALGWLNLSICEGSQGLLSGAEASGRHAFELDPDNAAAETQLGFTLLFNKKYAEGFKHLDARFRYKLKSFLSFPVPQWQGETSRDLYLVSDQGIGDTLAFSRFAEAAIKRCRYVHMAVQPELVRLFGAAFGHLRNLSITGLPGPFPPAQTWTTFMSLPTALGLTDAEIAQAQPIAVPNFTAVTDKWKNPDAKLHIGVCWSGSPGNDINNWRSFPMEMLLELYQVPGIQLYSLQVDDKVQELHSKGAAALIRDMKPMITDVSDTIGLLKHVDFCIGCDSALSHICAMVGKEYWMPYSYHGRVFYYGHTGAPNERLWLPHHRIFRQWRDMQWRPVFDRIIERLRSRVHAATKQEAAE